MTGLTGAAADPLFAIPHPDVADTPWTPFLPLVGWLGAASLPGLVVVLGQHKKSADAVRDALAAAGAAARVVFQPLNSVPDGLFQGVDILLAEIGDPADAMSLPAILDRWSPCLSDQALLLAQGLDTEGDPAGWHAWDRVRGNLPHLALFHGGGLGLLLLGPDTGGPVRALCDLDAENVVRVRLRLARLGGALVETARLRESARDNLSLRDALAGQQRLHLEQQRAAQEEHRIARIEVAELKVERHEHRVAADARTAELRAAIEAEREEARERLRQAENHVEQARKDAAALEERLAAALQEAAQLREERDESARIAAELRIALEAERHASSHHQAEYEAARAEAAAGASAASAREDAARRALREAETRLSALQNSASWRSTYPLRIAMSRLRRLRPGMAAHDPAMASSPPALPAPATAPGTSPDPDGPLAVRLDLLRVPAADGPAIAQAPAGPDPTTEDAPAEHAATLLEATAAPAEDAPEASLDLPPAPQSHEPALLPAAAAAPARLGRWRPVRHVLFVAGEPDTPGAAYRVWRMAEACRAAGLGAEAIRLIEVAPDNLARADLVVLWRARASEHVETMIRLAHAAGTRVAFDLDDLMTRPDMAWNGLVDGVRTTEISRSAADAYFTAMLHSLEACDLCIATTEALATELRHQFPSVFVLPNSFDAAVQRTARYAVRRRAEEGGDGLVRIGYAGGTRTHQKDFAAAAAALARVLQQRPDARLVLFREAGNKRPILVMEEFAVLEPVRHQIEWRDTVPMAALPAELARLDISICPLELGNPFCDSKSELKYFEAALAGVATIASPTPPFRDAIRDGVTGLLPDTEAGWEAALLRLVDEPATRAAMARDAYHDVLWQFGPQRLASLIAVRFGALDNDPAGARAGELSLRRGAYRAAELPVVPDAELLFRHDALGEAEICVVVTSFNYAQFLPEALESVRAQTLPHLDLVVVDDGSGDDSVPLLLDWARRHHGRFNRLLVLRTVRNAGLGGARNVAVTHCEAPYFMVLDADNRLRPECCAVLLDAVRERGAAYAYPHLQQFGGLDSLLGDRGFDPVHLLSGNYIDAMALVAKWAWAAAGGYYVDREAMGWEDFSLWCRLMELGQLGIEVPEVLAEYRVHGSSMTNSWTERKDRKHRLVSLVEARHPWLRLRMREANPR
ncbi:glycosyltransferase [Rhizosaccharibacter radicis]|uniref:Glycosyltransferase n=1 Tax=Rhizosaccharibacter radicis TaxID=2782605 RepID=A0ABT1VZT6_9PROT|nr:glycosyltransferase [Acetobacteraceae bacterium KSS12]